MEKEQVEKEIETLLSEIKSLRLQLEDKERELQVNYNYLSRLNNLTSE